MTENQYRYPEKFSPWISISIIVDNRVNKEYTNDVCQKKIQANKIRIKDGLKMETFDELLRSFDLEYFGNGKHKVGFEKAYEEARNGNLTLLDVRTNEEVEQVRFGFALNIPLNEVPDRMNEIPKDKPVAVYCVSGTRAAFASVYLQVNGYENVRIIPESHSDITNMFKPGSVLKNLK